MLPEANPTRTLSQKQLAVLAFLLAACSLVYELAIAKSLSHLTGNAIVWESITIGVYIAGLGIGTWILNRTKITDPGATLFRVELVLAAIGALCVLVILIWHIFYRIYLFDFGRLLGTGITRPIIWFGTFGQILTLVVGIFSGFELPLLFSISSRAGHPGRYGRLFGYHYTGALAGTLLFGLWFVPYSSAGAAAFTAATVNIFLCFFLLKYTTTPIKFGKWSLLIPASILGICIWQYPTINQLQIKNFYYNTLSWTLSDVEGLTVQGPVKINGLLKFLNQFPDVERIQTHMQSIDVFQVKAYPGNLKSGRKPRPASFSVALDGAFQFNSESEAEYHEHIVHIPSMLFKRPPTKALVLGGGDGLLVREVLRYGSQISSVTLVEIDEGMINFSKNDPRIRLLNKDSLEDPKVTVITDDAFSWLRSAQNRFDVIYIDFPYPFSFDSLRLYSVEFLKLVAARLSPEGYMVMDVPLDLDGVEFAAFNDIVFNTVRAAGFKTILAYQSESETFITAALGLPVVYPDYFEYGFKPDTFGPNWFLKSGVNLREVRDGVISDKVNSIVRPRWLTEGNPRF